MKSKSSRQVSIAPRQFLPAPPRLAQRLLARCLHHTLREEVMGDLEEDYYATVRTATPMAARLRYWYEALHYLRPFGRRTLW